MATKTKPNDETKKLDMTVPGGYIEMVQHIKLEDLLPNPYQPATIGGYRRMRNTYHGRYATAAPSDSCLILSEATWNFSSSWRPG